MDDWRAVMQTPYSRFDEITEDEQQNFPKLVEYDICKVAEQTKGTFAWR